MSPNKTKQLSLSMILAVSFLIEFPLRSTVITILSFFKPLAYILTTVVFYIALFACFLVVLNPKITLKSVLKSICVVGVFAVFEEFIPAFFYNELFALFYEIIRPLLVLAVVIWANYWILKSKINVSKNFLFISGVLFVSGALFNILEYIRMIAIIHSMGNDIFSYLELMTLNNSIFSAVAAFFTYAFAFVALINSKSSLFNKNIGLQQ